MVNTSPPSDGAPLKTVMTDLFADWCDGLRRHQIHLPGDETQNGGIFCPDCGFIHGRCADALYPFLRRARETGDSAWIDAAVSVQHWSDLVSGEDGSFRNDVVGNDWKGITVFAALDLAEALHHHGNLLGSADRARWTDRLSRAAQWIKNNDWSVSKNINYPISAAAALAGASRLLPDEELLPAARKWGAWARDFFLPDGLLLGEGQRTPSPRGVYAVDALYNLEESLPNYALYAEITGDEEAKALVLRSFETHLDFVLPDGSIDAGWGSRAFKWTLWGSRTSDGIAGLLPYARFDDRIAEAVRRNVEYLRSCTADGLLQGGPHLRAHGREACIHHTISHAKALAYALDNGVFPDERRDLPTDHPRGIVTRTDIGTTFVSRDRWRASFTVSDLFYGAKGSHASGGAITMLWHEATGPLLVSSMSRYTLLEGRNMAQPRDDREITVLTPRLVHGDFTSVLDEAATVETGDDFVTARGHLTNFEGKTAGQFMLETRFDGDSVHFDVLGVGAIFTLPIVSHGDEPVLLSERSVKIRKERAVIVCESSGVIEGSAARVFHFVPGVQAVLLTVAVPVRGVTVSLRVEDLS